MNLNVPCFWFLIILTRIVLLVLLDLASGSILCGSIMTSSLHEFSGTCRNNFLLVVYPISRIGTSAFSLLQKLVLINHMMLNSRYINLHTPKQAYTLLESIFNVSITWNWRPQGKLNFLNLLQMHRCIFCKIWKSMNVCQFKFN